MLFTESNFISKPAQHKEISFHADSVLAYHITPPAVDQLDYDPGEPHRKMAAVTVYIGPFRAKAVMRISDLTNVKSSLEVTKSEFISFYNAEVTHPHNPNMPPIKNNLIYIRLRRATFSVD
jgi:hypothetical protein